MTNNKSLEAPIWCAACSPGHLFYCTQIRICLWTLITGNKTMIAQNR